LVDSAKTMLVDVATYRSVKKNNQYNIFERFFIINRGFMVFSINSDKNIISNGLGGLVKFNNIKETYLWGISFIPN